MRVICPKCMKELKWGGDFDAERYRYGDEPQLEEGIVSKFSCPCGVTAERYIPLCEEEGAWLTFYITPKEDL